MLVLNKSTGENKKEQSTFITTFLRNEVVTKGNKNVLTDLPNTVEHDVTSF